MFLPLPSYLVSSLAFNQSYRREGSSERGALLIFLTPLRDFGAGGNIIGAATFEAEFAAAGDSPPELNIHRPTRMTARAISTTAEISLVRFSAPIFT